ncbi:MAG: hypothetical protein D3925_01540 [Candidatus Electrothrix sp. AR5]|nr:hypothetical protein [Candidatus Electrothrix sp. AR5]
MGPLRSCGPLFFNQSLRILPAFQQQLNLLLVALPKHAPFLNRIGILRGRFDYTSLNSGQLDSVSRFAVLIPSEEHEALVREVGVPQR